MGTFTKALDGARLLADLGYEVALTTVTTKRNLAELPALPGIAKAVGARSHHLMWTHKRGRAAASQNGFFPHIPELLAAVQRTADAAAAVGAASVAAKPAVATDPVRFLTGGGDWEHAWCFSGGDPLAPDPYYPIQLALVRRVMTTLGKEKRARANRRSGYDAPLVLHAMGEGAIACGTADGALAEQPVLTLHSNCVLSFDVDKPRAKVREYYAAAAAQPKADLCCPTKYDAAAVAHIPPDVLDRFSGCGSPMLSAGVTPGETIVDLGSGAGIDLFVAGHPRRPTPQAIRGDKTDAEPAGGQGN